MVFGWRGNFWRMFLLLVVVFGWVLGEDVIGRHWSFLETIKKKRYFNDIGVGSTSVIYVSISYSSIDGLPPRSVNGSFIQDGSVSLQNYTYKKGVSSTVSDESQNKKNKQTKTLACSIIKSHAFYNDYQK